MHNNSVGWGMFSSIYEHFCAHLNANRRLTDEVIDWICRTAVFRESVIISGFSMISLNTAFTNSSQNTSKILTSTFSLCISSVSSSGSSWLLHHHSYCFIVGLGLLLMTLTVCIAHCKAKSNNETNNNTPNRQIHLPQHSNFANRR